MPVNQQLEQTLTPSGRPRRMRSRRSRTTAGGNIGGQTVGRTIDMFDETTYAAHTHGQITGLVQAYSKIFSLTPVQAKQRLEKFGTLGVW